MGERMTRRRRLPEETVALPLSITNIECISSQLCGRLVIELIKHVVYWRGQIPASAQQLQHFVAISANNQLTEESCSGPSLRVARQRSTLTRMQHWSSTLSNISKDITAIFSTVPPNSNSVAVRQVALVFGATPVSPKETHVIQMPRNLLADTTETSISYTDTRKYFSGVFKTLAIHAAAIDLPNLSPTNMFTMIEVDGQCAVEGVTVLPQHVQKDVKFGGKARNFIYSVNCDEGADCREISSRLKRKLCLDDDDDDDDDGVKPLDDQPEDEIPGCTWYRLQHTLKGFL